MKGQENNVSLAALPPSRNEDLWSLGLKSTCLLDELKALNLSGTQLVGLNSNQTSSIAVQFIHKLSWKKRILAMKKVLIITPTSK